MTLSSAPRAHADEDFLRAKVKRLSEPHVAPINILVRRIRRASGDPMVPFVDPDSAGVRARIMFLLEAPAGAAAHGSGMLSPDNDDGTAANMWKLYQESGLPRGAAVHWNAVPWYLGAQGRIRPATRQDISEGLPWLGRLVGLLPELALVVTMGGKARNSFARHLLSKGAPLRPWLSVPHPSGRVFGTRPELRAEVLAAFQRAAELA